MAKIVFTDPHIREDTLAELEEIFQEILLQKASELIMIGDYYDHKKPNAYEIEFGTKWAMRFKKKFKKVIFLRGNHDKTREISAIEYLQHCGIQIVDEYTDDWNNYYGHFMTDKSKYEYGTAYRTVKELQKYHYAFLGHQHSFQTLYPNVFHLGSCRYVNFNETTDKQKFIVLVKEDDRHFITLESPIPMQDVHSVEELSNINPDTKVRWVISSFDQFKNEVNLINEWKDRFVELKVKLDFQKTLENKEEKIAQTENKKLHKILEEGINKIEDKDVRELLWRAYEGA